MSDPQKAVDTLFRQRPEWAGNIIMAGLRGSDAHGTKLPPDHPRSTDDTDTFGISVQPVDWYLGLQGYAGQARQSWDTSGEHYDHLIHDVRKFFSLALKGNPNVQCWLWADDADVPHQTEEGRLIRQHRRLFLSRRCFRALGGYARSQLKKMDRKRYQGYQGKKRKELVDELGYDVKHASHCIRLLNMGIELAETANMHTRRPEDEAAMLMEIKAGDWPYRRTESLALDLWNRFQEAEEGSDMRPEPERDKANKLMVRIIHTANE